MISIFQLLSFLLLKVINNNKIHVSLLPVKFALNLYNRFKGLLLTFAMGRITISDIYWNTGTWFFGFKNLLKHEFCCNELRYHKSHLISISS